MKSLLIVWFLVATTVVSGQEVLHPGDSKKEETLIDYEMMLDRLRNGDTSISFVALRKGYASTSNYSPYTTKYRDLSNHGGGHTAGRISGGGLVMRWSSEHEARTSATTSRIA